jgi:hypothetical protein
MEIIAKNVHENWAQQRMSEGWTYGEIRDDEKKTTPCLVPYEELSEVENALSQCENAWEEAAMELEALKLENDRIHSN